MTTDDKTPATQKRAIDPGLDFRKVIEESAGVFAAQAEWHERHGHPLADIMVGPCADTWKSAET
ncbi:hypothetical protein [Ruegeria atlantica]|uniref:hypothetical protein n=1 Tax=Ruegeria atlantica TaxID=81569 RepID=UPI00249558D7|nr:hypothetical protein [Ruegeria atlantica]